MIDEKLIEDINNGVEVRHAIEIEDKKITVTIGNTKRIKLSAEIPENAEIYFVSENDEIAYVKDGVVIAERLGKTGIQIFAKKGTELWEGALEVVVRGTVYQLKAYPKNVYASHRKNGLEVVEKVFINIRKTSVIQAAVGNGSFHSVEFTIADPEIASIRTDGIFCYVTGKEPGETILTATFYLGEEIRTQMVKIRIVRSDNPVDNPREAVEYNRKTRWKGYRVYFGHYEQDNDYTNGPEPIVWRVLEVTKKSILLMSEECLEQRYFHNTYEEAIWRDSDIRKWLNGEFLDRAFTMAERRAIRKGKIKTMISAGEHAGKGVVTEDKVYLLSTAEATNPLYGFYPEADSKTKTRCAKATNYAVVNNGYQNEENAVCWWLRDNGVTLKHGAYVFVNGKITTSYFMGRRNDGVRPVVRLELSKVSFAKEKNGYYRVIV